MNVPNLFRKALDGFVIPPRTFSQMFFSAARGAVSLVTEEQNRADFLKMLDNQIINEGVISQATASPLMMLSLFHDLQNPLFKRHDFNAVEFLEGVGPALERFHNVSGSLENQLRSMRDEAKKKELDENESSTTKKDETVQAKTSDESFHGKEEETFEAFGSFFVGGETGDKSIAAVLEHDWMDDAKKDPDSLAGQLSRMVTTELFNILQISGKTAFLLSPPGRNIVFKEGSCTVNNVALLSARSFLCVEKDAQDLERWGEQTLSSKYELIDYDMDEAEMKRRKGGVAAQLEVLYDVTQTLQETIPPDESNDNKEKSEEMETTIVSVAVMEGWLNGGPDGELRWRLALHRPAFEFPGIAT